MSRNELRMSGKYVERIMELRQMKNGWLDGECDAPSSLACDNALIMCVIFDPNVPFNVPIPGIFPMHEGGIQFEWTSQSKDCHLEFHNDGRVRYSSFSLVDEDGNSFKESWFNSSNKEEIVRIAFRDGAFE